MQREDGASMFRCDVAIGKAWASVGMGVASRTLLQRAKENPHFFGALAADRQGKFLPQTGAVRDQGQGRQRAGRGRGERRHWRGGRGGAASPASRRRDW